MNNLLEYIILERIHLLNNQLKFLPNEKDFFRINSKIRSISKVFGVEIKDSLFDAQ
jgi:hypothetical protein